jgi:hypothetical protein
MSKPEQVKAESAAPAVAPKPVKMRRWGGIEFPEADFIRVTFLASGSVNGERFTKGRSADVPKSVFAQTLKPNKQAVLYVKPAPVVAMQRPATDKGNFKRVTK